MNGIEQLQRIVEMQKSASVPLSPGMEKQGTQLVNGIVRGLTRINPAKAGLIGKDLGWGTRMWNQFKAIPANAIADVQSWMVDPWLWMLQKGGRLVHGKDIVSNKFYRWLTKHRHNIKRNVQRTQRLNNYSTGYGYRTNDNLKYAGDYITDPKTGITHFKRTVKPILDEQGNPVMRTVKLPDGTEVQKAVTEFVPNAEKIHPNLNLSRWALRAAPGMGAVTGITALGSHMSDSDNPWVSGAGKFLHYADPFIGIPKAFTAPIKWGTEALSPWLKEYYRSKYYDAPPNLLGHLYKTFNPSGYSDHLKTEVDRKMNDYLSGRSGAAIARDIFTGKVGDSSTSKDVMGMW